MAKAEAEAAEAAREQASALSKRSSEELGQLEAVRLKRASLPSFCSFSPSWIRIRSPEQKDRGKEKRGAEQLREAVASAHASPRALGL